MYVPSSLTVIVLPSILTLLKLLVLALSESVIVSHSDSSYPISLSLAVNISSSVDESSAFDEVELDDIFTVVSSAVCVSEFEQPAKVAVINAESNTAEMIFYSSLTVASCAESIISRLPFLHLNASINSFSRLGSLSVT